MPSRKKLLKKAFYAALQEAMEQNEALERVIGSRTRYTDSWQYSDIEISVSDTGLVCLKYENVEAYVRPGASVKLEAKEGHYSYPPIPLNEAAFINKHTLDQGHVEETAMPVKRWNVTLTWPDAAPFVYQVEAFTEDGAVNAAGAVYKVTHGRFPHEDEIEDVSQSPDWV
jgi:hypothetical protein